MLRFQLMIQLIRSEINVCLRHYRFERDGSLMSAELIEKDIEQSAVKIRKIEHFAVYRAVRLFGSVVTASEQGRKLYAVFALVKIGVPLSLSFTSFQL